MKKIFAVGFESFAGLKTNPSEIVVRTLWLANIYEEPYIQPFILPLERKSEKESIFLQELLSQKPDAVIIFGAAPGRNAIYLEEFFFNRFLPEGESGENFSAISSYPSNHVYFSTADLIGIARKLRSLGIPAELSRDPGIFFCNYIAYLSVNTLYVNSIKSTVALIHLPVTSEEICENPLYKVFPHMPRIKLLEAARVICDKI